MSNETVNPRPVELDDVQGILRFGFSHHTEGCFLLLQVKNPAAACAWLSNVPLANAVVARPAPATALQVAISSPGLTALGVPEEVAVGFSEEFRAGMAGDNDRSRRLGDLDCSHPSSWRWGAGEATPHVLLMLYALPGKLAAWRRELEAQWAAGFSQLAALDTTDHGGREPFGFRDGISQPEIDWERRRPAEDHDRLEYDNLTCLGEFLLGYPNEYGLYTDRPLLDSGRDPDGLLPRAEERPELADLGRNGSYLVLRELRQDVAGFWRWLAEQAGGGDRARGWAEAMVGRTVDGKPLIPEAQGLNGFNYDADPEGLRCPIGAHVRRANPRNADYPPGTHGIISRVRRFLGFDARVLPQDLVASTRFHRILRRGRAFGEPPSLEQALADPSPTAQTGLHFICLGANIGRQFEFVQSAWIVGTRFAGLPGEGDPLLGHRAPGPDGHPTDCFSVPRVDGPDQRLCGLPRFISVCGGGYFFLPGIRALRFLTSPR